MAKPKSYKYAQAYQKARDSYEKAYFADKFNQFAKKAITSIDDFCVFFIFFSLPDNPDLAADIVKGDADFNGQLETRIKPQPKGKQLIKYIYQSPATKYLEGLKSQFLYALYDELCELQLKESVSEEERYVSVKNKLLAVSSLFDDLFVDVGNLDEKLEKALDNCKQVTSTGYKKAKTQVKGIYDSISSITKSLDLNSKQIASQRLTDTSLQSHLNEQLRAAKDFFVTEADKAANDIEEKRRNTDNYNVTLFGRTNVGKSTLMEILTNGKGNAIGHGAQRTTLDVRAYNWKGLSVTDVPGIDAYDGKVDEVLADRASRFADEIIFMITAGQPENIEAKWLVKLKHMDKPMLCICNVKRSVEDERHLNKFLDAPEMILDKDGVQQAIDQFKDFVKQDLPNEDIHLIVTHLRSRFLANQEGYEGLRDSLIESSRFADVENAIIKDVITNGILYRKKCYLSILDIPVYSQMCSLLDFSASNLHSYTLISEAETMYREWSNEFKISEKEMMRMKVEKAYEKLERQISSFVDDNLESDDFGDRWKRLVRSENIEGKVNEVFRMVFNKAKHHTENTFKDLNTEMSLSSSNYSYNLSGAYVGDYGKALGWTSGGLGLVAAGLAFVPGAQVIAIVLGVASAVTGLTSMIWTSREKRLRKKKIEKIAELTQIVKEQKDSHLNAMSKEFDDKVVNGIIKEALDRFSVVKQTLQTLADGQRSMAMSYLKNHNDISGRMIMNALEDMGMSKVKFDSVARVPGKKTVIVSTNKLLKDEEVRANISRRIGNSEIILSLPLDRTQPIKKQFNTIADFFELPIKNPEVQEIPYMEEIHVVAKCKPTDNIMNEADNILLMEQILGIQIVFNN